MKLTGNTILITGGSSGIGRELSRQLCERNNTVIICARSQDKLLDAQRQLPSLTIFPCDLSDPAQCEKLVKWIQHSYPTLNMVINGAAVVHQGNFLEMADSLEKAEREIQTNFMAPVRLIKRLFPLLQANDRSAIINITTGLIYSPRADYPFYNATKAALHSFTQVLREQTKGSTVSIIETMFPAVDTPWHRGHPPTMAISPEKAVTEMLAGLEKGLPEIRVARVKLLYALSRLAPRFAFRKVNSLKRNAPD